jgi:vacuolar-type H+-ATPase subunit I/STV1
MKTAKEVVEGKNVDVKAGAKDITSSIVQDVLGNKAPTDTIETKTDESENKAPEVNDETKDVDVKIEDKQVNEKKSDDNMANKEVDIKKSVNLNDLDSDKAKEIISEMENTIRATYEAKLREIEEKKQEEILKLKEAIEKERLSKMSDADRKKHEERLKKEADEAKMRLMEERIRELEEREKAAKNTAYINEQIQKHPYIKDAITRMNIKTKEDFDTRLAPMIDDIRDLHNYREQNYKYGNSNAYGFGNYNQKSNERKDITDSIKSGVNSFLNSVIAK